MLLDGVRPGPWEFDPRYITIVSGEKCIAEVFASDADASFIAAARDLVPALLAERDDLRTKLDAAVEALDKLARLGNGNMYGNSDGNMIARATLRAISEGK